MIPRDRTCWYCERGQHEKCFSTIVCACRVCDWPNRPASARQIHIVNQPNRGTTK